jgi:hypothetical protein
MALRARKGNIAVTGQAASVSHDLFSASTHRRRQKPLLFQNVPADAPEFALSS